MRIKVPISPGEFFDKLTIQVNKVYSCKGLSVTKAALGLLELAGHFPGATMGDFLKISHAVEELRDTNKQLWDLEELVRVTKDPGERLMISDKIRELNSQRSEVKNVISEQLGGLQEVKDYATSTE